MPSFHTSKFSDKKLNSLVDYLFWITMILYTNPGGIFEFFGVWYVVGKFNVNDFLFIILTACYIIVPKLSSEVDQDYVAIKKYLIIFLAYYLIVFAYLVPNMVFSKDYSLVTTLIKSRWTIYNIFLFMYIYEFFKRRWDLFFKLFIFSSIVILSLFIQSFVTKINILPIETMDRGFVKINRIMLVSYGFMPLLVPLGAILISFKLKTPYRLLGLIGFSLISISWVVSITRRHIIGVFIYLILSIIMVTLIKGQFKTLLIKLSKSAFIIIFMVVISFLVVPKFVKAAGVGIVESFNILETGKESRGEKDERIGFTRPFIMIQFAKSPLFGTGFDNRWRTKDGDDQGFEASDYPFIAALAMFGIIGVLIFTPVYIRLIRILGKDIRYLKKLEKEVKFLRGRNLIVSPLLLLTLTFILYFIFDLIQYWNYFFAVSNSSEYIWFSILAFYLASRERFYSNQLKIIN